MKKLNSNNLSEKQLDKIKYKAAFSQFVQSLKQSEGYWFCCNATFSCLKNLHKHVSCNHMNDVVNIFQTFPNNSNDSPKRLTTCHKSLFPGLIDDHCCSCSSKSFVVVLFYKYRRV